METLFELLHKKNSLPQGNIYEKKIKNKIYKYYQYRENGFNFTKLISEDEENLLSEKIDERKVIEAKIKFLLKNGNREIELSNNAKEYTGYVMSGDTIVAEFEKGVLKSDCHPLCPYIIKRTKSIFLFLKSRSIDCGRTNSRLLRKILNIKETDETLISLCSYAASISDNYWFKPKNSKLKYKDICFNNDMFFETALKGLVAVYPKKIILTPELTTNGGYEKGWRNHDGEWWLFKVGTKEERFSEMFFSRLFEKINLPTAHYEIEEPFIKTKNFSSEYNFEPMISFVGENDDIEYVFESLCKIDYSIALQYLRLCFFDVVLNNVDRHNENCGILRDKRNGRFISLAPNYDDNLCLISRSKDLICNKKEGFLNMFIKLIDSNQSIKKGLKEIDIPLLNERIIKETIDSISISLDIDFKMIEKFILLRYNTIVFEINK